MKGAFWDIEPHWLPDAHRVAATADQPRAVTQFLPDTSTVSAAVWKLPDAGVLEKLEEHDGECAISASVWHELQYGTQRLPKGKRRQALEAFLDAVVKATLPILPYDERARLERAGKSPPFVDGPIAAIASTCGLFLVTANPGDFKPFKGLAVVNWARRNAR